MRFQNSAAAGLLYGAEIVSAAGYADDRVPTVKDEPHVAANFPEFDYEVIAPAFLDPEGIPKEFEDGTVGPTDQDSMGRFMAVRHCIFCS